MQSRGEAPNMEASMAKLLGTELLQRVAREEMSILGLYGQTRTGVQVRSPPGPHRGGRSAVHVRDQRRGDVGDTARHHRHPRPRPAQGLSELVQTCPRSAALLASKAAAHSGRGPRETPAATLQARRVAIAGPRRFQALLRVHPDAWKAAPGLQRAIAVPRRA